MKKILKNIFVIFCVCSLLLFPLTLSTAAEEDEQTRQDPNGATTRRALVISAPLEGGLKNCEWKGMKNMFERNEISTSSIVLTKGDGNTELFNIITTTFAATDTNDVSYVYINSHGDSAGNLYLDGKRYTPLDLETLRFKLDGIYGRVILMIDACYSGNAIQRGESTDLPTESISQSMLDTFLDCDLEPSRSGEFADRKKYVVYCACRESGL